MHKGVFKTEQVRPSKRCISLASCIFNGAMTAAMDTQVSDAGMALPTLAEVHRSETAKLWVCGHSPGRCMFMMCQP